MCLFLHDLAKMYGHLSNSFNCKNVYVFEIADTVPSPYQPGVSDSFSKGHWSC